MVTYDNLYYIIEPVPAKSRVGELWPYVEPCLNEFDIGTPLRQAAFFAQLAHESGKFRWFEELASGAAYEGRLDLGNEYEGDGMRFKGRGLIQLTGANNYKAYSQFAYGDENYLVDYPQVVAELPDAIRCAGWFWWKHSINGHADAQDFERITRIINGGLNGYEERIYYYHRALEVIH